MAEESTKREQAPVEAKWNQIRSSIRAKWTEITSEDLRNIDGDSRKLVALINQKTKAPLPEIEAAIDELAASSGGLLNRLAANTRVMAADVARNVSQPVHAAAQSVRGAVTGSPATSVVAVFGAGFLAGLGIGLLLMEPEPKSKWGWKG